VLAEEHKGLIRRFVAAENRSDFEEATGCLSPDITVHIGEGRDAGSRPVLPVWPSVAFRFPGRRDHFRGPDLGGRQGCLAYDLESDPP
jgi:hypothetical protein